MLTAEPVDPTEPAARMEATALLGREEAPAPPAQR